jgi:hypothetical protein
MGHMGQLRALRHIGDRRSLVGEVEQAGMLGGGVETTGGGDQFPGHLHAEEHLASGLSVVAGSLQNGGNALGSIALVQEVEDGLAVGGTEGTGAQAGELVVVSLAQPVDGGDICFRGSDVVGQRGRLRAEGMFGGEQEQAAVAGRAPARGSGCWAREQAVFEPAAFWPGSVHGGQFRARGRAG